MGKTMADLYTAGGHPLDEAASALQKCIRRGMLLDSLYWAQELESKFHNFLWKRLVIISHEDVGMANPNAVLFVETCRQQFYMMRSEHHKAFSLPVINAVQYLVESPKTRMADHLYSLMYQSDFKVDVPDFALDKHTRRGRHMGRGMDHFYMEGAVIEPDIGRNEYLEQAWRIDEDKQERPWLTDLKARLMAQKNKRTVKKVTDRPEQRSMF